MEAGNVEGSKGYLELAANCMGQPIPVSWIDSFASLIWQILVVIFHKVDDGQF